MPSATSRNLSIVAASADDSELRALLEESDRDLLARYSSEHIYTITPGEPQAERAVFLLARSEGVAVACGALLPADEGSAEIKRMFVRPEARRRGIARELLAELESSALELGCTTIRLETGSEQPESIALYESAGYGPIPRFGEYADDPYSLCYEKRLADDGYQS